MRVEALALLGRYAGADRRSGLVPPVLARSCAHTAARASTWQWHPGCRHRRIPQRPSGGTGGQNGPLARVHDSLPGIHAGDKRLSVLHPEHHRAPAFLGAPGAQKVDEAIRRSACCHAERL